MKRKLAILAAAAVVAITSASASAENALGYPPAWGKIYGNARNNFSQCVVIHCEQDLLPCFTGNVYG